MANKIKQNVSNGLKLEENNENESLDSVNFGNKKKLKIIFFIVLVLLIALVVYVKLGIIDKRGEPKVKLEKFDYLNNLTSQDKEVLKEKEDALLKKKKHCETMPEGAAKENCLEIVKSLQVTFLDKPELCNQLDDQKDQCLKNLALHRQDQALCDLIDDASLKRFCTDSLSSGQARKENDISLCGKIEGENQRNDCIDNIIELQGDLSFCDSEFIINNDLSDRCQSIILLRESSYNDDSSICEQIPLELYRDICYRNFERER